MAETSESKTELSATLNLDAQPVVTALKSISRAAKEAIQSMRELENYTGTVEKLSLIELITRVVSIEKVAEVTKEAIECGFQPPANPSLSAYTTVELHEELVKRTGVQEVVVDNGTTLRIEDTNGEFRSVSGPARIIINQD